MKHCNIYIDDGYLAKISKHFGNGRYLKIDYYKLANNMSRDLHYWCIERYFYTAPPFQSNPPTPDESRRKSGYDKLIAALRRSPGFFVREGRLQKIDQDYHQKGVDTLFTMDLMRLKGEPHKVKTAILLTCDTDFVPVITELKEEGIEFMLYYYSDSLRNSKFSLSDHLTSVVDEKILISRQFLDNSVFREPNINHDKHL